ncbi:kinase-like protein [Sporormia fimetaria CBS 119925]|uniref:Kinase-like protein n=1 Tax=Sporormia fimetaria CBS 119925 TaxID=1340428 RepID=A0A6A6UZ37_9PLEO|nr:kinase-like protein [Sporormia fimetaria CBS 119925]
MIVELFSDGTPVPADGKWHTDPGDPMTRVRIIADQQWKPPNVTEILSGGNTAHVGLLPDGSVLKFSWDREESHLEKALDIEHQILSSIGPHDRITRYLGKQEHGLCFERATKGDVRRYMESVPLDSISVHIRLKWATQAAEALAFIHSRGVIHSDIHPNNFILDDALDLRLCDFSGSVYGELDGFAMESTGFCLPRPRDSLTPAVKTDLFALGSTIYYFMNGHQPYDTLSDEEVTARYSKGDFPEVDLIPHGQTILGCWKGDFDNAEDVLVVLARESKALTLS